uniref:YTH domain-containing protein n=1 Tax=Rhabditophanes sp. KR3021 TaxID=114890 RepID=A0AC35TYP6_9BILA
MFDYINIQSTENDQTRPCSYVFKNDAYLPEAAKKIFANTPPTMDLDLFQHNVMGMNTYFQSNPLYPMHTAYDFYANVNAQGGRMDANYYNPSQCSAPQIQVIVPQPPPKHLYYPDHQFFQLPPNQNNLSAQSREIWENIFDNQNHPYNAYMLYNGQ